MLDVKYNTINIKIGTRHLLLHELYWGGFNVVLMLLTHYLFIPFRPFLLRGVRFQFPRGF